MACNIGNLNSMCRASAIRPEKGSQSHDFKIISHNAPPDELCFPLDIMLEVAMCGRFAQAQTREEYLAYLAEEAEYDIPGTRRRLGGITWYPGQKCYS